MNRNLKYIGDTHGHHVRNANDFRLQKVNKKSTTKSLFYLGLQMFNSLPSEIKMETELNRFKRLLVKYVKENF